MSGGGVPELREVAAAVLLRADRVLVQTRPGPGRYQGYWEFPGGGVEPGEDHHQALARECREELDLAVAVHERLHRVEWSYPRVRVAVSFFRCTPVEGAAEPRPVEGQELRWADRRDLDRLTFLPANAEILALLAERLGGTD